MHKPEDTKAVAVRDAEVLPAAQTPQALLALAIEKGADPTFLSKMLDVQERWEALEARKEYVRAMTAFKQEAPSVLAKDASVDFTSSRGRTHYRHVTLGSVVQQITAIMGRHGLSAGWSTDQREDGRVVVTCHITHARGHSESVTLMAPPDDSGNKNKIQQVGSTVTYLQRYTLLAVLGLATADQDDDGVSAGARPGVEKPERHGGDREQLKADVGAAFDRDVPPEEGAVPPNSGGATTAAPASPGAVPVCECGKPMKLRTRKDGKGEFWGCTGYPSCRKTQPKGDAEKAKLDTAKANTERVLKEANEQAKTLPMSQDQLNVVTDLAHTLGMEKDDWKPVWVKFGHSRLRDFSVAQADELIAEMGKALAERDKETEEFNDEKLLGAKEGAKS